MFQNQQHKKQGKKEKERGERKKIKISVVCYNSKSENPTLLEYLETLLSLEHRRHDALSTKANAAISRLSALIVPCHETPCWG